jgi:mannosyltransferase
MTAIDEATAAPVVLEPPAPLNTTEPIHSRRWRTIIYVVIGVVVGIGIVLRFVTQSALWLDEALTVNIAGLPIHDLQGALKRDGAPPLFYFLLHFWMKAFGTSDLGTRSLAGVISVATLPFAWFAARRLGGKSAAWVMLVVLASAPFAVYYGTEDRMYALVMFFTAAGFVALARTLERPRPGNVAAVALCTAGLMYSQYWSLYLVGTVFIWLAFQSLRKANAQRHGARWSIAGIAIGCIAFLPWVPTFLYQSKHTGTPWAAPPTYAAIINAITGFTDNQGTLTIAGSNQSRLLALCYFALAGLGLFGLARDRFHIDVDVRTRPRGRGTAFVVVVTLALAVTGGILTKSAFAPRYASVVFIPLLLLLALGSLVFADAKIRLWVVAVVVAAGLATSIENIWTLRTQAPQVASLLAAHAKPGDLVAFCPDQLGPSVVRLLPSGRYQTVTFPRGTNGEFVNWVDYLHAVNHEKASTFTTQIEAEAGSHDIWYVSAPGYYGFDPKCGLIAVDLINSGAYGAHQWVNFNPGKYYQPMNVQQFAPLPPGTQASKPPST